MPLPLTGTWAPQTWADYPFPTWSVEVGGTWYLGARARTSNSFSSRDIPEVVEINPDGTGTAYPQSLTVSEFGWKSAIAYGQYIYIGMYSRVDFRAQCLRFDTVSKTYTLLQLVTSGSGNQFPGLGRPALGPDGMIYFPPYGRVTTAGAWTKLDPTTNTLTAQPLSGWPASEFCGQACMGGDGNMYFFPGMVTASGGGFQSGTRMGYLSFPGPTLNLFPLPLPRDWPGSTSEATTWIASAPAPDGVYAITSGGIVYKVTTAGPEFLQGPTPWADPEWYVDNGELTDQVDGIDAMLIEGPDGKFYTMGYHYNASSNYSPVAMWIDPSNDEVHFQEFLTFTGKPFVPTAMYVHDGDLHGVSVRVGAFTFPDQFRFTPVGPSGPPDSGFSFYVGDRPVSLYVGDRPVQGWYAV